MASPGAAIMLAFPVFFVCMWFLVLFILSRASGWHRLAARFETPAPPEGEAISWASCRLGATSFRNAMNFVLAREGLYLRPSWLFQAFCPGLLIPWSEVYVRDAERKVLWMRLAILALGPDGVELQLFAGVFARFEPFLSPAQRAKASPPPTGMAGRSVVVAVSLAAAIAGLAAAILVRHPR